MLTGKSPAARYGVAVLAVCVVAVAKLLVDPFLGEDSPFLLLVIAVVVAAWLGGAGPGLAATAFSALVGDLLFLPPEYSLWIDGFGTFVSLGLFVVEGVVISAVAGAMHSARRRSEANEVRAREQSERSERSEEDFRLLIEGAKEYAILMLTPDGRVTSWNEGARRILGYSEDEVLGERFDTFFTPEDRRDGRPERELEKAINGGMTSEENWAVRKDGSRLWANGSTSSLRDEEGNLRGVVKVVRDRTEARRSEEELRLRDRAIAASANGIIISDPNLPDNPIVYANPAFEKITGYSAEEALGRNCRFLQGIDRDQPELDELRAAIREGRSCEVVLRNYRKDGSLFFNELTVSPVLDDEGRPTRFIGVQNDVTGRERAEVALGVLAEAGGVLAKPLDYQARLSSLASLVVPRLADWCAVDVVEDDGSVRRLAVEHQDPARIELAYELERRYGSDPDATQGIHHVIKTGEAELVPEIPEQLLREGARDEEHLDMLQRLGLSSYMILPMVARGRTLGAITFVWAASGRNYGEEELALARTLVRRAATAVENARLYEEAQREISEREQAVEALARSEERYRAVIEQSTEGIYLIDAYSRRLLETNPSFQAMLGYDVEELRGMELYDLLAHSREDVDANIGRTLEAGGRPLVDERTYRRKDGTLVNVEVGVSTISYDSHRAICATVRDVTARKRAEEALKRSEERFRSLVRYASDIIVVLDGEGEILFESPAVERVLGFTARERMGKNAFDFLHPEDRGPVADRFAELAKEPGGRISAEYRTRNKEGDWRSFEAIGVNLLDDPVIRGIVVNSRDVTERKRTERAMNEIREAERGRIARELHDGVLQDLSYTAQAMEVTRVKYGGTGVETDLEEAAEAIRRAARELREAIYDLRIYRDDRQGVVQLFESLIELNRRRMPGRAIEAGMDPDLLDSLSERGGMELLRVVQEALTNVRRHSGARNVRVDLATSGDTVGVEVSDDGSGFDPEALPPGVGTLGMRERALGLGGTLEIESQPGSGTKIRFTAPLENLRR